MFNRNYTKTIAGVLMFILALVLLPPPAPAQGPMYGNYDFMGAVRMAQQADLQKGLKIGATGAQISNLGALTALGITNTGTLTNTGPLNNTGDVAITGGLTVSTNLGVTGTISGKVAVITDNTSVTATQLTAAQSGATCVLADETGTTMGDVQFKLPAAEAGLRYTFIDGDPTAAADLWITAGTGDKINGGTAGKSYKCTGDAVKQFVTIQAIDDERWEITSEAGTWANDNS